MINTISASHGGSAPARTDNHAKRAARTRITGLVVIAIVAISGGLVTQFQATNAKAAAMQMQAPGPFSFFPH